jgi:hypothetical protein
MRTEDNWPFQEGGSNGKPTRLRDMGIVSVVWFVAWLATACLGFLNAFTFAWRESLSTGPAFAFNVYVLEAYYVLPVTLVLGAVFLFLRAPVWLKCCVGVGTMGWLSRPVERAVRFDARQASPRMGPRAR